MLTTLRIKNLALVENITLEFEHGLNMITGETGAGKSILIGALGLLLGERADKTLIRGGEDACGADAVFQLTDPAGVDALLEEFGLEPCDDGQLLVRRIIRANGSGQTLVNDSPVTLQVLRRIGELLVDMHGPHDHQSLLKPEAQVDLLDAYGHLWAERADYEKQFARVRDLMARREALSGEDGDLEEVVDLLRFRVKEIEEAELKDGEEEEIGGEHSVIGNAQRILEVGGHAVRAMTEEDGSAFEQLAGARRQLDELARLMPEAETWQAEMDELVRRLQELSTNLQRAVGDINAEPARLEWLDQRLATYQKLKKKYGPTVGDVAQTLEDTRVRLHDLETREEQREKLDEEIAEANTHMHAKGGALSDGRTAASGSLAEAITAELKALGFGHGEFSVEVSEADPTSSGMDTVEFGFAPNVGEPMRPLRTIASSGEISRVMLATKKVLADHDRVPVLVFDEIDANLGGEMGHAVGAKLAEVARTHQVLCITHLPQVAVFGQTHFAVAKAVRDDRTITEVKKLADADARAREVARMLGGRDDSGVSLEHARELLEQAG